MITPVDDLGMINCFLLSVTRPIKNSSEIFSMHTFHGKQKSDDFLLPLVIQNRFQKMNSCFN